MTIYVRHSAGCKYADDEFAKRCNCRKWLRWTQDGNRQRVPAKTRSWAEAEQVRREIEDQLSGKMVVSEEPNGKNLRDAIKVFVSAKEVEGLTADRIGKLNLWLGRFASFLESKGIFTCHSITGEHIVGFCKGWESQYPSALTRSKLRESYKTFMRFCQAQGWLNRLPDWPKIQAEDKAPTMPLTDDEYERLLDSVYAVVKAPANAAVESQTYEYWCKRVRGLFLLMRWSGLSIMDALTCLRERLFERDGKYRIVTQRTKTGTDVSVVIPPTVAEELLDVPNDNPAYLFWSGRGTKKSICGNWGKRFIVPCFLEAKIESNGYLRAHRLRDTFACDLLTKGVPIEDVSKLLAHRSVRTTEKHYGAWVKGRQDRLDGLVEGTWTIPKAKPKRRLKLVA